MKLFYAPGACSLASHIVLEWIGQPYETHQVEIHGEKSPELLERNSSGAVPVIEDDGWVLSQNAAILNYLADSSPDAGLGGGENVRERAEINQWIGLVNADIHPAYKPLFGATGYLDDEAVEETKVNAKNKLRSQFEIVNDRLANRDWLTGTRSVADPYLYVMLRWARGMQIDLAGLDHLKRFVERIESDSGVRAALKAEGLA